MLRPVESVPLLGPVDDVIGEFLAKEIEVDGTLRVAFAVERFGDDGWEQLGKLVDVRLGQVWRCRAQFFHGLTFAVPAVLVWS